MIRIPSAKGDKIFDCITQEKEGTKYIICTPKVKDKDGNFVPIGSRPAVFRKVSETTAVVEDDGGLDIETLDELDKRVIPKFLRG